MKYKFSFIWDKCAMADHMLVSHSVLRNCQITFHGGYATLHSHVQRKNDLIFCILTTLCIAILKNLAILIRKEYSYI